MPDFCSGPLPDLDAEDLKIYLQEVKFIKKQEKNELLNPFLNTIEIRLNTQIALKSGQWVNIDFTKDLEALFSHNLEKITVLNKSSVLIEALKASSLKCRTPMDSNFEVEYEIEHIDNFKQVSMFTFLAIPDTYSDRVSVHVDGKKTIAGHELKEDKIWTTCYFPKAKSYKVKIKFWKNALQYDINNGSFFELIKVNLNRIKRFQIGSGYSSYGKGKFKLSNLRFRQHNTPMPKLESVDSSLSYLNEIGLLENNAAANAFIGYKYDEEKQYNKAKPFYKKAYELNPHAFNTFSLACSHKDLHEYQEAFRLYQEVITLNKLPVLTNRSTDYIIDILLKEPNNLIAANLVKDFEKQLTNAKGGRLFNLQLKLCKLAASMKQENKVKKLLNDMDNQKLNKGQQQKLKKLKENLNSLVEKEPKRAA